MFRTPNDEVRSYDGSSPPNQYYYYQIKSPPFAFALRTMMLLLPPSSSFGVVRLFVISAVVAGTSRRNGIAVAGFHLSPSQLLATTSSMSKSTLSSAIQRITNKMLISTTSTAIHVGAASTTSSFNNMNNHDNANNYPQLLLDNASACALSDSCSIEYAEMYLREIFRVQVGCAVLDMEDRLPATTTSSSSSTATATNAAIAATTTTTGRRMIEEECNIDNLHAIGEIVAKLKDKIRHHGEAVMEVDGKNAITAFWNQRQVELETLAASTSVDAAASSSTSSIFAAPIKPAYLAIAALYTIAIIRAFHPPSTVETTATTTAAVVVPFTFQEIWYAIRDGYIDTLIGHWFHNGGLLIGGGGGSNVNGVVGGGDDYATLLVSSMSSTSTTATTPSASSSFVLSPQEVFWSIRDGYVDDTLFSSSSSSSSSVLPSLLSYMESSIIRDATTAPFSPQEVWWAIQDGYVADMVGHWFRNGGE